MQKFIPYIYIAFFLCNIWFSFSQKIILNISAKDSTNTILLNTIPYQKIHPTEFSLLQSLDTIKNNLEKKGFINFSLDTIIKKDSIYNAKFNLGSFNNIIRIFYNQEDITKKQLFKITASFTDSYFDIKTEQLEKSLYTIVELFENQGKSFSEVSLKNISLKKEFIEATLTIKKTETRKIDKIIINGYESFPSGYLSNYLQLKNNSIFNRSKLNKSSDLIHSIPFVSEIKPPEILFTKDSTIVYLFLKKEVSNKFDGLVGFTSKEGGKGISFNGYLDLMLNNIFNIGESFTIFWKNNGEERQDFTLSSTIPYIFQSGFSLKASLDIYKQDSTFINTKTKLSIPYTLNEQHSLGLSIQSETSSNLLIDPTNSSASDFNNVFYGIHYNYQIFNQHPLFPIKFNLFSELQTGRRNLGSIKNRQSIIYVKSFYLWSLNVKNHFLIQNESSTILSENVITNELFRIGGVNSIRGFNEESLFASTYSYFNFEYRFNPNNSSYLYSITDLGYFENRTIQQSSRIYSLGVGYAFRTKLGLLNLSYAIGRISTQPFDFQNSRFHLKVISIF